MKTIKAMGLVCLLSLVCVLISQAQTGSVVEPSGDSPPSEVPVSVSPQASVLRLIRFNGSLNDVLGQPLTGVVGVTFALYAGQEGGSPLWLETQNVTLDEKGHYAVLLGATSSEGLPLELFTSGEARWLDIRVQGQSEQPRVLLVAVPYALRAEEAQRLAGREASEFLLAEQLDSKVQEKVETQVQQELESQGLVSEDGTIKAITDSASTFADSNNTQVVLVTQQGSGVALRAQAVSDSALVGFSSATSGTVNAIVGRNSSPQGRAVYGQALSTTGVNFGIMGQTPSNQGRGAFGLATSTVGLTRGLLGEVRSPDGIAGVFNSKDANGQIIVGHSGPSNTEVFSVDGNGGGFFSGNVGIGTPNPVDKLHIEGGTDASLANGTGFLQLGGTSGANIVLDNNEIQARNNGTASPLYLNFEGGNVGIGIFAPSARLDVRDSNFLVGRFSNSGLGADHTALVDIANGDGAVWRHGVGGTGNGLGLTNGQFYLETGGQARMIIDTFGHVGVGREPTGFFFHVNGDIKVDASGDAVLNVNRVGSDGKLIDLIRDGSVVGNITVSSGVVSYNAFTGSHFAWTSDPIEQGTLVTLTGDNKSSHGRAGAEPIYGVAKSRRANDPAILGAYLGRQEPDKPDEPVTENPHLVAAVGNGDMWVVDTGSDIEPGDLLISSDTSGHAMKDSDQFEVSYVVARAAEPVRWSKVTETIRGHKHKLISVLFDNHVRGKTTVLAVKLAEGQARIAELQQALATQAAELSTLEAELAAIKATLAQSDNNQLAALKSQE